MAEWKHTTTSTPSSASMTSLGRALSRSRLSQPEGFQSQKSRGATGQTRRRYSSSSESPDNSPNVEARVLVINTGGTIGMTYHNNGKLYQHRSHTWLMRVHICTTVILHCRHVYGIICWYPSHISIQQNSGNSLNSEAPHYPMGRWKLMMIDLKDKATGVPNVFGHAKKNIYIICIMCIYHSKWDVAPVNKWCWAMYAMSFNYHVKKCHFKKKSIF